MPEVRMVLFEEWYRGRVNRSTYLCSVCRIEVHIGDNFCSECGVAFNGRTDLEKVVR